MPQGDLNIANQSGAGFRADLNNQLLALGTLQSGPNEPSTTYAYQFWADTNLSLLKQRNGANNAWITIGALNSANLGLVPSTQTATTSVAGIVQLNDTVTSTSTTEAATANAVKTVNDFAISIRYNRRPVLHRDSLFFKTAAATLSVVAGAVLNGIQYAAATAVTMPSHSNNTDYAIWQHPSTGALVGSASFSTAPTGAAGGSIVGGYHYIPSGRPTAVNNGSPTGAAEILEYSIWDLTWRPTCPDPRGMSCIDGRYWIDLYFCGKTSYAGTDFSAVPSSKIGLTIADNNDPPLIPAFYGGDGTTAYSTVGTLAPGSWMNFTEVAQSFGKRLPEWGEFSAAAFGAPEAGSRGTDPGTVIWERASKWGLAQATGTMWVWGVGTEGNRLTSTTTYSTHTGGRGSLFAGPDGPRAVILGGDWGHQAHSGSRNAAWVVNPWDGGANFSARFAAGHLVLG